MPYICYAEAHGQPRPMPRHSPCRAGSHITRPMNPFLRFTACLLVIFVVSAAAAMAWDHGDHMAAQQAPQQTTAPAKTGR